MRIWTHLLRWVDDCPRWVWQLLTPEQWGKLRHIGHVAIIGTCVGAPPAAVLLTPTPVQETINPHSPRAGRAAQGPTEEGYGPSAEADILRSVHHYRRAVSGNVVHTPEPGTLVVLLTAIGGVLVVRRRR